MVREQTNKDEKSSARGAKRSRDDTTPRAYVLSLKPLSSTPAFIILSASPSAALSFSSARSPLPSATGADTTARRFWLGAVALHECYVTAAPSAAP